MTYTKRQIEIIQAATALMGEKGIQHLTTKSLAERMNFTEPALYRHFKDKTAILVSVLDFFRSQLKEGLEEIIARNLNGMEKLHEVIRFQFNHFHKNPAIVMVIFAESSFQYEESLSEAVLGILNSKKALVQEIISQGQQDKSIRNDISPSQLAIVFMGSMRFGILQWRLNKFHDHLPQKGEELFQTINLLVAP